MGIIQEKIKDYEKLINTDIRIPLDNGDLLKFAFKPQDLPHLLGLQYLVDIPVMFEYSEGRVRAKDLYNGLCGKGSLQIDIDELEKSKYFSELYQNRICHFSSDTILEIIKEKHIVKFNPNKVPFFETKLDKIDYMFWKKYKISEGNYGYFGIGCTADGKKSDKNYPNTFFFRGNDDYIRNQEKVLPLSLWLQSKNEKSFAIYWEEIEQSLKRNSHYKYLKQRFPIEEKLNHQEIELSKEESVIKHYELLQMDEINRAYQPYMKPDFRWNNEERRHILKIIKEENRELFPNEMLMKLNQYRQKEQSCLS